MKSILCLIGTATLALAQTYNPLVPLASISTQTADFTEGARTVPVKIYSSNNSAAPVILFSHGLGGTREASPYLGEHWAARGYVVVFMQHPGSDASVWQGKSRDAAMQAMKQAASPQQYKQRIEDVQIVLAALAKENANPKSNLFGKMDLRKVGMSGHSFGAKTTQAVSGESFVKRVATASPQTTKIAAALPMSPSPSARQTPEESFGSVSIPWLCMTGTEDGGPTWLVDTKPTDRLKVFESLPKTGHMYELVLFGAEHSAFTQKGKNPSHHRSILATSTAFWDAYLKGNPSAQEWLKQSAPNVLDENDVWRFK